jgi:uncharacterized membrane protein
MAQSPLGAAPILGGMDILIDVVRLLPWPDWAAMAFFFAGWVGYAWFAHWWGQRRASIIASTNRIRRQWMLQITYREVRVIDGTVIQNLSTSPSFFASTTILIIGGLLAVLGSNNAGQLVKEIPFAVRTSALVFDLKIVLLLAVFVYAFFRFTWSMRQYTFGALLVASAPEASQFALNDLPRDAFADRAGRVVGMAAETFNDGLRAYYMSFAAVAWFFSAWAFMAATAAVLVVLYRREFHSEVLMALREGLGPMPQPLRPPGH